jgi:hypothetical protein
MSNATTNKDSDVAEIMKIIQNSYDPKKKKFTANSTKLATQKINAKPNVPNVPRKRSPRRQGPSLGVCVTSCLAAYNLQMGHQSSSMLKKKSPSRVITSKKTSPKKSASPKKSSPSKSSVANQKPTTKQKIANSPIKSNRSLLKKPSNRRIIPTMLSSNDLDKLKFENKSGGNKAPIRRIVPTMLSSNNIDKLKVKNKSMDKKPASASSKNKKAVKYSEEYLVSTLEKKMENKINKIFEYYLNGSISKKMAVKDLQLVVNTYPIAPDVSTITKAIQILDVNPITLIRGVKGHMKNFFENKNAS